MDSAQTEELARRIARWVRESRYTWDTVTHVLTIIHEDDDGVEKFTLAQLAENDPEKFEQFALLRPSPERAQAGLTLVSMLNSGGDAADAGAFPLFLSKSSLIFRMCCRSRTRTRRSCSFSRCRRCGWSCCLFWSSPIDHCCRIGDAGHTFDHWQPHLSSAVAPLDRLQWFCEHRL